MIVGMQMKAVERETFISVVTFLFSVPFLIFSMPGGWLADRFSKRRESPLDQGDGIRVDAAGDSGIDDSYVGSFSCGPDTGRQPSCAVWSVEVRLVA